MVGASGSAKSTIVAAFYDGKTTYFLNHITKNTLASGQLKNIEKDLAPKLNGKLVITGDLAQFVKLHSEEKGAIYAQLREAYDGRIQRDTGSGVHTFYENNYFDWLACSTPIIDEELILKNELGTRELIYRLPKENSEGENEQKLMERVWVNTEHHEQMKSELKNAVQSFFLNWKGMPLTVEISDQIKNEIFKYAKFIAQLRATAEVDWRTGDLQNFISVEDPTRVFEQLKMLFQCLKSIDSSVTDEYVLKCIFEIVKSNIHPVRLKILLTVLEKGELFTTQIARVVGLSYSTTNRELQICKQLEILVKTTKTDSFGKDVYFWSLNQLHSLYGLLKRFNPSSDRKNEENTQIIPQRMMTPPVGGERRNYHGTQI